MFRDQADALCRTLAGETLARISQDRQRASVQVAKLLALIEKHLLQADLQIESLKKWCGQRDQNISTRFAEEMGLGPWSYVTQGRMEIAGRMLAASDVKVWRIGLAVGYVSGKSFSRAFKTWSGQSPSQFRTTALAGSDNAAQIPDPAEPLSREEIHRGLEGVLPDTEVEDLVDRLDDVRGRICANYPTLFPPLPPQESVEPVMARRLWSWIENLPFEAQKAAVLSQAAAFRTPALFHTLCTLSIEAGNDGVRAMNLASLALISLDPVAKRQGPAAGNWLARAQVIGGYACHRGGDLEGAAEAFGVATRILEFLDEEAHPVIILELCLYQAMLHIARGELQAATDLAETATKLYEALIWKLKQQAAIDAGEEPPA